MTREGGREGAPQKPMKGDENRYRRSSSFNAGTQKNRVKGKLRYRRNILVLKWENGTFKVGLEGSRNDASLKGLSSQRQ